MHNNFNDHRIWLVYFSFIVGIILQSIFSYTQVIYCLQPSWMMMLLVYWIVILPRRVNIGTGFILGLIIDCAFGYTLGIHALSLSIIGYVTIHKIHYFRYVSILQQSCLIILFSIINQANKLLIKFLITKVLCSPEIFWNCVLDGISWPIFVFVMRKIYY